MTTQKFKRKLACILSADVQSYSRLMGEDEVSFNRTPNLVFNTIKIKPIRTVRLTL